MSALSGKQTIGGGMLFGELLNSYELLKVEEEEYIDPKKVNLQKEYNRLNKKLFDGKLGVYPMKWNKRKTSGALVSYKRRGKGRNAEILGITGIELSSFYSHTIQALRDRLAHEMIHVYWLEKGVDYGHNKYFESEMRRINKMNAGVAVTKTEVHGSDGNIGEASSKGKPVAVVVGSIDDHGDPSALVMPLNKHKEMAQQMYDKVMRWGRAAKGWSFEMYQHDANWTQRFPVKRKMGGNLSMYEIKSSEIDDLRKNGIRLGIMGENGLVFGPVKQQGGTESRTSSSANTDDSLPANKKRDKKGMAGDMESWVFGVFGKDKKGAMTASSLSGIISRLVSVDGAYEYKRKGNNIVIDNGTRRFIFTTTGGSDGKLGVIDGVVFVDGGKRSAFRMRGKEEYIKQLGRMQNWIKLVSE